MITVGQKLSFGDVSYWNIGPGPKIIEELC